MSFYSEGVKTKLIDSQLDLKNKRSEFRFDDNEMLLSNFRLMDLGFTITTASKQEYNYQCGIFAYLKNIYLMDGNIVLDQILGVNDWLSFKNYNNDNNINRDVNKWLGLNSLGYTYFKEGTDGRIYQFTNAGPDEREVTNNINESYRGWLNLASLFPFLSNSEYVPTHIYKKLKLIIEYDMNKTNLLALNVSGNIIDKSLEPLLVVDQLTNTEAVQQILSNYKGVKYLAIENDKQYIEPISGFSGKGSTVVQKKTFNINGFDNKTVNRMLMINKPTVSNVGSGYLVSSSMIEEKHNFRVNGRYTLPFAGLDKPNKRLARMNDTFGTCNSVVGTYNTGFSDMGNHLNLEPLILETDYTGLVIADRVTDLEIDYQRTGIYDDKYNNNNQNNSPYNQGINLNFYGEVQKEVVVGDNMNYKVTYK